MQFSDVAAKDCVFVCQGF